MADWRNFRAFVKSSYEVTQEETDMMQLIFATEGDRTQVVYLWHWVLRKGTEDWLAIESPFAELQAVDLEKVVVEAGGLACGGVVAVDDVLAVRHVLPLANLDINEFKRPLELVTSAADHLEQLLFGDDRF
ncbi:MAG TPA: hypothetical protein VGJ86_00340 [Acidimicrobiales bacterium]|jgi:hypothetical protein